MKVAEQRQQVAHGVSRGLAVIINQKPRQGRPNCRAQFLPPHPGLDSFLPATPRLPPWAIIFRLSGA